MMRIKGLIIAISLIFLVVAGCGDEVSKWPKSKFDEHRWAETAEAQRYVFVHDLLEGKKLLGISKLEVIRMLGKPSYEHPKDEYMTYIVRTGDAQLYVLDLRFELHTKPPVVGQVLVRPM